MEPKLWHQRLKNVPVSNRHRWWWYYKHFKAQEHGCTWCGFLLAISSGHRRCDLSVHPTCPQFLVSKHRDWESWFHSEEVGGGVEVRRRLLLIHTWMWIHVTFWFSSILNLEIAWTQDLVGPGWSKFWVQVLGTCSGACQAPGVWEKEGRGSWSSHGGRWIGQPCSRVSACNSQDLFITCV